MQYSYATKIIHFEGTVENADALLQEKPLQIGLDEPILTTLRGKACVILDFGKELSGGARLLVRAVTGSKKIRLRFGESVGETCADIGEKNATNDHSNRDMFVDAQNYSDMTFGQTGFRFLRIDTLSDDTVLAVKSVLAAVDTDTREALGSFECDDESVNRIWNTAAHTIRLCLQNGYFWDGIKRDRLVWIGDLYPEMRAAHCVFGDVPETENSLKFVQEQSPLPKWMNNFETYSLWWLIILSDEFAVSGEKARFECFLPYVKGLLQQLSDYVAEDGSTKYHWDFIDWPSCYTEGQPKQKLYDSACGAGYLTTIALKKIRVFLTAYKEDTSLCEELLARLSRKQRTVGEYKQMAGLGVWAGDLSENNKQVLLRGGAKGMSTFMSYPILSGVAAYGEYEAALQMMKEYYGGMLSVGATSFWEDFNLDWLENCSRIDEMPDKAKKDIHGDYGAYCYIGFRHSLCHGWSSGVIPYLIETVVGIKPEVAGMRRIRIQPHLSGLKHVKANFPTPYGVMTVEHTLQKNGEVKTDVFVPDGVEVVYGE